MKITSIKSQRTFRQEKYWQIVHRWEDILSKELDVPLISHSKEIHMITEIISSKKKKSLVFDMIPNQRMNNRFFTTNKSIIPYIIDFWCTEDQIPAFIDAYNKAPLVLISSKEVYEYLKKIKSSLNIQHLALSIPDEDAKVTTKPFTEKKFDLVVAGRTSEIWNKWITLYGSIHPDFKVVRRKIINGTFAFEYDGKIICNTDSRSAYLNLLSESKVFIYSTPGMDGEKETNGFHPVTPRFMEGLTGGCNMILRYPDNPDTKYFELHYFGESVENFEMFCQQMDKARSKGPDIDFYSNYLRRHTTSMRAKELKEILKQY